MCHARLICHCSSWEWGLPTKTHVLLSSSTLLFVQEPSPIREDQPESLIKSLGESFWLIFRVMLRYWQEVLSHLVCQHMSYQWWKSYFAPSFFFFHVSNYFKLFSIQVEKTGENNSERQTPPQRLHLLWSLYDPFGPDFQGIAKDIEGNGHNFEILMSNSIRWRTESFK